MSKEEITTADIITMVNLIDICAERGAFKGNELFTVGQLREKFASMVKEKETTDENPSEEQLDITK